MNVEVFIGDLSDPDFDYDHGNWSGNIPKRISPFFPQPHKIFFTITKKMEEEEIKGKQTDWGSWTAILYPSELLDVTRELYGDEVNDKECRSIVSFVRQLEPSKQYGLVACEIG